MQTGQRLPCAGVAWLGREPGKPLARKAPGGVVFEKPLRERLVEQREVISIDEYGNTNIQK